MEAQAKQELLARVHELYEQNAFEGIIDLLEPNIETLEFELALELARAYINHGNTMGQGRGDERYLQANALLDKYGTQGKEHAPFLFYKGYALFKLGLVNDALIRFNRALRFVKLGVDDSLLPTIERMKALCESFDPDNQANKLSEADEALLYAHIKEHMGSYQILFKTDRYELLHIKPDDAHPWNLIVTKGLAGKKLKVPLGVDELTNSHVELAVCLPPEWQFSTSEEYNLWPINALCELINFILAGNEFVGFGYTFSNDKPWHSSTDFSGGMLTALGGYNHRAQEAVLSDGSYVRFFELIFLYPMELAFRKSHDASALIDLFVQKGVRPSPVRKRSDVCAAPANFTKI